MGDTVSSVVVSGNTRGAITIQAPAVAGSGTLTLPSGNGVMLSSVLNAGNTTFSPITFASGNLLNTASAGSIEYDGKALYGTPSGALRGVIPGCQFYTRTSASRGLAGASDSLESTSLVRSEERGQQQVSMQPPVLSFIRALSFGERSTIFS